MTGKRDDYLARLDGCIRILHGQEWDDRAAKEHKLAGLVEARHMYAHPDQPRFRHAGELAEALAGPLLDEDEPLFPAPLLSARASDARLDDGWAVWEGGREYILGMWPGEKVGRNEHAHAHAGGPYFSHSHPAGNVPHDHEPGDRRISKDAVAEMEARRA